MYLFDKQREMYGNVGNFSISLRHVDKAWETFEKCCEHLETLECESVGTMKQPNIRNNLEVTLC